MFSAPPISVMEVHFNLNGPSVGYGERRSPTYVCRLVRKEKCACARVYKHALQRHNNIEVPTGQCADLCAAGSIMFCAPVPGELFASELQLRLKTLRWRTTKTSKTPASGQGRQEGLFRLSWTLFQEEVLEELQETLLLYKLW